MENERISPDMYSQLLTKSDMEEGMLMFVYLCRYVDLLKESVNVAEVCVNVIQLACMDLPTYPTIEYSSLRLHKNLGSSLI